VLDLYPIHPVVTVSGRGLRPCMWVDYFFHPKVVDALLFGYVRQQVSHSFQDDCVARVARAQHDVGPMQEVFRLNWVWAVLVRRYTLILLAKWVDSI
jgi:hypothetical protein